jgi:hypothetical protein
MRRYKGTLISLVALASFVLTLAAPLRWCV